MNATFTPIDNAVLVGLQQGDEGALERLFRGNYDALLEEAKSQLDEPGFAPRVVETAILRAWDKHGEFLTPAALETFLHHAVHEGAIREKSRRASVHRLESHESAHVHRPAAPAHIPTVDEAWTHVASALHVAPPDPKHLAQLADMSRHAAAGHLATVGRTTSLWTTLGYGAAAVATVAALLFVLFRDSPEKKANRLLASADAREIIAKFGQIGTVTLDDGSKALIGADSKLVIPPRFGTEVRAVRVVGTASFEVATGQTLPFEVRLGETAVIATGTKFAVNFDTGTAVGIIKVTEGSVNVRHGTAVTPLSAGAALAVTAAGEMREATTAQLDEALGWSDGRLVVVDKPLRAALDQVRRWYAIALIPSDAALLDRKVSIDAKLESSKEMIADLETSGKLVFGWDEKTMMLYDSSGGSKPKKK